MLDVPFRLTQRQPTGNGSGCIGQFRPPLALTTLSDIMYPDAVTERCACMENHQHRFYCHVEANGTWAVWDCITNKPARLGGGDLLGCTAQRAEAAEQVLTTIYNSGLDAIAVRLSGIVRQLQS